MVSKTLSKFVLVASLVGVMGTSAANAVETQSVTCPGGRSETTVCAIGLKEKGCRGPNQTEPYILCLQAADNPAKTVEEVIKTIPIIGGIFG